MDQDERKSLEAEEQDARAAQWLQHPLTKQVADGFGLTAAQALVELLGAARMSTDHAVVKWVTVYDAMNRACLTMKGSET